jgi:RES domain-containing protein
MHVSFASNLPGDGSWLEDGPEVPPDDESCRKLGDDFLRSGRAVALRVPSVIVPFSRNVILNPAHPMIAQVAVQTIGDFAFDRRLLNQG